MKKTLILVLIVLLLALSMFTVLKGISIGNLKILGVNEVKERSLALDEKIQEAGKLAEKDYVQSVKNVESNAKQLKEEKENYQDMVTISQDGGVQVVNQIEKYEVETLWVRLGNHATSQGVVMKMDIQKGANSARGIYNLAFTATGDYISITDFISAIENDSTLGFKIEEFEMNPSGDNLQATFVCKDIAIKDVDTTAVVNEQNNNNTNNANNANSNATNSTANNTTNTASNNTTNNNTTNNTNSANLKDVGQIIDNNLQ